MMSYSGKKDCTQSNFDNKYISYDVAVKNPADLLVEDEDAYLINWDSLLSETVYTIPCDTLCNLNKIFDLSTGTYNVLEDGIYQINLVLNFVSFGLPIIPAASLKYM